MVLRTLSRRTPSSRSLRRCHGWRSSRFELFDASKSREYVKYTIDGMGCVDVVVKLSAAVLLRVLGADGVPFCEGHGDAGQVLFVRSRYEYNFPPTTCYKH